MVCAPLIIDLLLTDDWRIEDDLLDGNSSPDQFGFRPTVSRVVAANAATTRDMSAPANSK
jgi:hypothetical protein